MRFSRSAVALGLALMFFPCAGQAASDRPVFGSSTCPERFACRDVPYALSSVWAEKGDACLAQGFGFALQSPVIDDRAGLDSENCLTSVPNGYAQATNMNLDAKCCVVALPGGEACALHCQLIQR